jgi:hypothetical protein
MLDIQRPKGAYFPRAFPVGSVFIAVVSTDPATLLGYGTWSAFGAGRVLVGLDGADTDFDTVEETGGAKTKAISAHANTAVADHAAHTHAGPSHQHNLSGGAATTHSHTYTDVVNHTHSIVDVRGASTGAATTNSSGLTAGQDTSSTAVSIPVPNPSGGVATGTTAVNTAGATDAAGTGNTGNPSATLTHSVTQPDAHTNLNVVQPYVVCYFWKRTA